MIGFKNSNREEETAIIATLTDHRLIKIDPQENGFFDAVINFNSKDKEINAFIEAIVEAKESKIDVFYKLIYDPTENGEIVTYKKGKKPAVGYSYNWWVETANKMPKVEGRQWKLATEYQYYSFLVWLINQLVKDGKTIDEVLNQIVNDSKELGHYYNSENSMKGNDLELTGSRCICGVCDLANTYKILTCSNKESGGFWLGGGCYVNRGDLYPLANLYHSTFVDFSSFSNVGMLVL